MTVTDGRVFTRQLSSQESLTEAAHKAEIPIIICLPVFFCSTNVIFVHSLIHVPHKDQTVKKLPTSTTSNAKNDAERLNKDHAIDGFPSFSFLHLRLYFGASLSCVGHLRSTSSGDHRFLQ